MRSWALRLGALSLLLMAGCGDALAGGNFGNWRKNTGPRGPGAPPDSFTLLPFLVDPGDQCTGAALASTQGTAVACDRNSDAYCTKSDGSMVLLSTDECRTEETGFLREPTRTNLLLRSQELTSAAWSTFDFNGRPIVTHANAEAAPDGTMTAECFDLPSFTVAFSNRIHISGTSVTGTAAPYSSSVYVKGVSGTSDTGTIYLTATADGVTWRVGTCSYTSAGWSRCKYENQNFTATDWFPIIGMDDRMPGVVDQPAQSVCLWGGVIEAGAFVSTYIPTAGTAVARAAESLSATLPSSVDTEGCLAVTSTLDAVFPGAGYLAGFDELGIRAATATSLETLDGTGTASITIPSMLNATTTAHAAWSGVTLSITSGATTDDATFGGTAASTGTLYLEPYFGHTRNVRVSTSAEGCQ